jgi:hypothetical protein
LQKPSAATALADDDHLRLQSVAGYGYRLMDTAQALASTEACAEPAAALANTAKQAAPPVKAPAAPHRIRRYSLALAAGLALFAVTAGA